MIFCWTTNIQVNFVGIFLVPNNGSVPWLWQASPDPVKLVIEADSVDYNPECIQHEILILKQVLAFAIQGFVNDIEISKL